MENPQSGMSELTTYYLKMLRPEDLCEKSGPPGFVSSILAEPDPELNQQLYKMVGGNFQWTRRLTWTDDEWIEYLDRPNLLTGIAEMDGQLAGYFEMEVQADGDIEIVQLGLLPEYVGRGLGGALVTAAIKSAWAISGTRRVWLHTCTLDHDNALENYKRRGFSIFKTVTKP